MVVVLLKKDALPSRLPLILPLCFINSIHFYATSRAADLSLLSRDASPSLFLLDFFGFILLGFFTSVCGSVFLLSSLLNFKLFPFKTSGVSTLWSLTPEPNFFLFFFFLFTNLELKHRAWNLPEDTRNLLLDMIGNNLMCRCHSLPGSEVRVRKCGRGICI